MSAEDFKVDATYAILQDPASYDYEVHGPPYLPPKAASVKPVVKGMIRQAAVGKVAHFYKVVEAHVGPYASMPYGELAGVLVFLRALAAVHQSNHWATLGPSYYGDHLLFDRLYGDLVTEIDTVAEKAVGLGGPGLVSAPMLAKSVAEIVTELCIAQPAEPDPEARIAMSLQAELRFLVMMQMVAKQMESKGTLSRGTDNMLADIEDKHEEHVYLLKQRSEASKTL